MRSATRSSEVYQLLKFTGVIASIHLKQNLGSQGRENSSNVPSPGASTETPDRETRVEEISAKLSPRNRLSPSDLWSRVQNQA
ncbi:MAG: hypothetical protein LDL41_01265 [Coleofasciculus sp. S288]|nr:hypothetical protein [Coleofasciculus sp. S288]